MKGWKKISETRYMEMLEVLPPALWIGDGFLVGEPWDHDSEGQPRFQACYKKDGEHWASTKPTTKAAFREFVRGPWGKGKA